MCGPFRISNEARKYPEMFAQKCLPRLSTVSLRFVDTISLWGLSAVIHVLAVQGRSLKAVVAPQPRRAVIRCETSKAPPDPCATMASNKMGHLQMGIGGCPKDSEGFRSAPLVQIRAPEPEWSPLSPVSKSEEPGTARLAKASLQGQCE